MADRVADFGIETGGQDHIARRHPLQDGIDGGHHHCCAGIFAPPGQRRERRQPLAFDVRAGRHAVIGQTIPGGEIQHLQLGREKANGIDGTGGFDSVLHHEQHQRPLPGLFQRNGRGTRQPSVEPFRRAGNREAAITPGDIIYTFQVGSLREHSVLSRANTGVSKSGGSAISPLIQANTS